MPDPLSKIYNFESMGDLLATSGQPTESQFEDIAQAGYSAVINLALSSSDNAIDHEGSLVCGQNMAYFHIPVDFENPKASDLKLFIGVMEALQGHKVWVHCVVNARVSAFVFKYLTMVKGVDDEAAKTQLLHKWLPQMDDVWRNFLSLPKAEVLGVDSLS